ncbi:MAG: NAD(P)H-dependent glycerol-3-phosphate dehydrogenase, partial [Acidimicrobiia bacterium]
MDRIAVIGAGSWGTIAAALAASDTPTMLWARHREVADGVNQAHRNPRYLPDHPLPDGLVATPDLADAVAGAGAVVMAVPSHGFRGVFSEAAPHI